jgi:hypothetical protein
MATSAVVLVLRSAVLFDSSLGLFTPEKPRPINLSGLNQMFGQDVKDAGKVNPTQQSTLVPLVLSSTKHCFKQYSTIARHYFVKQEPGVR